MHLRPFFTFQRKGCFLDEVSTSNVKAPKCLNYFLQQSRGYIWKAFFRKSWPVWKLWRCVTIQQLHCQQIWTYSSLRWCVSGLFIRRRLLKVYKRRILRKHELMIRSVNKANIPRKHDALATENKHFLNPSRLKGWLHRQLEAMWRPYALLSFTNCNCIWLWNYRAISLPWITTPKLCSLLLKGIYPAIESFQDFFTVSFWCLGLDLPLGPWSKTLRIMHSSWVRHSTAAPNRQNGRIRRMGVRC